MSKKIPVRGINYVRPSELKFTKKNETKSYTKYEIETFKSAKQPSGDDIFTRDIDSLIFCNDKMTIKVPKPGFMKKEGKSKFAYAFGMFPNPKNGKAAYLDGCILGALGLKRQKTIADVICFITHDISEDDKKKLEVVFDKVIYVPYISPYDMGGEGDLKTIKMDPKIFQNCNNYTKEHPYSHVFFKLHIFNPDLFPYEKVCFIDSDLVPMNYFDSLFMLNTPAGWIEYRKKMPFSSGFHWDRCDYLKHGEKIPKIFTDIDTPGGSEVNAGLMVVSPSKKEYDSMIKELTSPLEKWMGKTKFHKGYYDFDFSGKSIRAQKFVANSYCYPEQNYLTKRYSGKWTYIEFAFQSWTLDPCNSFGIHMAAFNPKPWFKQPVGTELKIKSKNLIIPYVTEDMVESFSDLPKAFVADKMDNYYENISYSYEIFNDLMVWGLLKYEGLKDFFLEGMEIRGPKISFDRDVFKPLTGKDDFLLIKDIIKSSRSYKQMSLSQQSIYKLLTDYDNEKNNVGKMNVCLKNKVNRYGEKSQDKTIITWPGEKKSGEKKSGEKKSGLKTKKKTKKGKRTQKTKKQDKKKLIYFYMDNCKWCKEFQKIWQQLKKNKSIKFMKINGPKNPTMTKKYKVNSYPTLVKIEGGSHELFEEERTLKNLKEFLE